MDYVSHDALEEAQALAQRYRRALRRIVATDEPWCDEYGECGHVGCEASHAHVEIARRALAVDS